MRGLTIIAAIVAGAWLLDRAKREESAEAELLVREPFAIIDGRVREAEAALDRQPVSPRRRRLLLRRFVGASVLRTIEMVRRKRIERATGARRPSLLAASFADDDYG